MIFEVFITNGSPLESTCKKGDVTTTLNDLTEQEQSNLATAIAAMLDYDATNCGYLVDNSDIVDSIRFNFKHPSVSSDTVTCDKGANVDSDLGAINTPLSNLMTSIAARI